MVALALGMLFGLAAALPAVWLVRASARGHVPMRGRVVYRIGEIVEEDAPDISA